MVYFGTDLLLFPPVHQDILRKIVGAYLLSVLANIHMCYRDNIFETPQYDSFPLSSQGHTQPGGQLGSFEQECAESKTDTAVDYNIAS